MQNEDICNWHDTCFIKRTSLFDYVVRILICNNIDITCYKIFVRYVEIKSCDICVNKFKNTLNNDSETDYNNTTYELILKFAEEFIIIYDKVKLITNKSYPSEDDIINFIKSDLRKLKDLIGMAD